MRVAREGVPEAYEKARIMGIVAKYQLISSEPDCSANLIREHMMYARYEVHLKAVYSNAGKDSVKDAARKIAAVDANYCSYNSPEFLDAVKSIRCMIDEHKANSKLVSSLRK
ncbi:MAG: hypothetical protein M1520_00480 [Candidatus Marsarchaeota archaeon]|nr:hypothetical protein [Candidatus Marsarchaeota archaeon]